MRKISFSVGLFIDRYTDLTIFTFFFVNCVSTRPTGGHLVDQPPVNLHNCGQHLTPRSVFGLGFLIYFFIKRFVEDVLENAVKSSS